MTQTATPYVRYVVENGFATLTLDSPHNRNALSTRLVTEFLAGLAAAAADDAVRGIVVTHTGNTFCAGADLSEASSADPATAADDRARGIVELLRVIVATPKPVLAVIDGHVRAGGMGIVAACDIVVAGTGSSFALTEARLGLAPFIISLTLAGRLSSRAASRYYLTGERFGAAEAAAAGLITMAADDPRTAAAAICADLRKGSPQGLAESKRLTTASTLAEFDRSADELARRSASFFGSDEVREGMMAFLQKTQPSWAR